MAFHISPFAICYSHPKVDLVISFQVQVGCCGIIFYLQENAGCIQTKHKQKHEKNQSQSPKPKSPKYKAQCECAGAGGKCHLPAPMSSPCPCIWRAGVGVCAVALRTQSRPRFALTLRGVTAVKVMDPPSSPTSGCSLMAPLNRCVGMPSWIRSLGRSRLRAGGNTVPRRYGRNSGL